MPDLTELVVPLAEELAEEEPMWNRLVRVFDELHAGVADAVRITPDGRFIGFIEINFVKDGAGGELHSALMLYDRETGSLENVLQLPDSEPKEPIRFSMSSDARWFAFAGKSSMMAPENPQIYLYDRKEDELRLVSKQPSGLPGDGMSDHPSISADGRYIAYDSDAPGLADGDRSNFDIFVYDRDSDANELISVPANAEDPDGVAGSNSEMPAISADGRYVAFESSSAYLVEGDENGYEDVFVFDREEKRMRLISVPVAGGQANNNSGAPSMSADGGVIAFESYAALAEDDTNGARDIYVYRSSDSGVERVSVGLNGEENDFESYEPLISADGAYVSYEMWPDGSEYDMAMIGDLRNHVVRNVSVSDPEMEVTEPFTQVAISADGAVAAFNASYPIVDPTTGLEVTMPGLFIASKVQGGGQAPSWPDGSKLEAKDVQPDRISLAWTPASDPKGIKEYRLYKDAERIASVDGNTLAYTATGLEPATEYSFKVEAVNADNIATAGGPGLRVATAADDRTLELSLRFDRLSPKRLPLPNSKLTIEAKAKSGRTIAAKIVYSDWLDASGERLPAPRKAEATVNLTEKTAGSGDYAAEFPIREGISELTSVVATMTGASGGPVEKPAEGLPRAVAGNLKVAFDNPGEVELNGAYLMAVSLDNGSSSTAILENGDPIVMEGVAPSDKYVLTLYSGNGKPLSQLSDVRVPGGLVTSLTLKVVEPTRYRFKVTDSDNKPLSGIRVEVWDEAAADYLAGFQTDGEGSTNWTAAEDTTKKYTAKVDLSGTKYDEIPNIPFSLKPGDNVIPVTIRRSPEGKLQGKVLDPAGKPVFNALVTATRTYKGKPVVQKAYTDLNGAYQLSVLAGEVDVQAAQTSYHYKSEEGLKAVVENGKTTTFDIPVRMAEQGMVEFKVYVKMIGGDWQGPIDMEQLRFKAELRGKSGGRTSYYQNSMPLQGQPGEEVEACVSGVLNSPFEQCTTIRLDEQANGTVEMRIEEQGGLFKGSVPTEGNSWAYANLYEVVDGELEFIRTTNVRTGPFELHAPKAGVYRLEFHLRDEKTKQLKTAFKQFTIREQETIDVGTVALQAANYFFHVTTNGFLAQQNEVTPGGTVNLRAFYQNHGEATVTGAALKIEIPDGASPVTVPGSDRIPVKLNGADATASLNGHTLEVALGDIEEREQGTVVLQARLNEGYGLGQAQLSARIVGTAGGKSIEETLGSIQLDVPKVTLEVPNIVTASSVRVIGLAPPSSRVKVYDGDLLLGTFAASSGGSWAGDIELTNTDGSEYHLLWAQAESGDKALRTEQHVVSYLQNEPVLQQIAMAQYPDGKWLQLDTENGIAQLPYTVVPGHPFQFVLKFNEPGKVKNVKIYLGGQIGGPVTAEKGEDGLFRATVPTSSGALGGLYVDYDTVKPKIVISREIPTDQETRDALPPGMKDFIISEKTPFKQEGNVYSGSAVIEFPGLPDFKIEASETIDLTPTTYRPTVEEIVEAEAAGLPVYNMTFDVKETADGVVVKTSAYMPKAESFPSNTLTKEQPVAALAGDPLDSLDQFGIDPGKYREMIRVTAEYKIITQEDSFAKKGGSPLKKIKSEYSKYNKYAGRITKIMDNVEAATLCPENIEATSQQAGKALLVTVGGEVAKTAITAWTGAMMLEGPLGKAAGIAGKFVSKKIDGYVDEQIDKVKTVGPTNPQSCEEDDDTLDGLDVENIYKKRLRRVYAELKWIYDPSGYVYEAVPSNRLEGVKATVLFKDKAAGEWKVWYDAPSYGQINPQLTDGEGKYGWDVPEGVWKVVWEKAGYETASSAELTVPPPHFDVNAGLVSKAPPIVAGIEAVVNGEESYVDVEFSKYLTAKDPVAAGAIVVTGPGGAAVEGTLAYLEPQEGGEGPLARKVRFKPSGPGLQEGSEYTVAIEPQSFVSYAGTRMLAGAERTVEAVRRDAQGPVPLEAEAIGGNAVIRIRFDEPLAAGTVLNPESFELTGTDQSVLSAVAERPEEGKQPEAVVLTLSGRIRDGAAVTVRAAAGAAADSLGNPSAEKTLALNGPDAALSALVVEGGTLTEPFSKEKTDYTVKVRGNASSIRLKATLAAAGGKLSIRGVALAADTLKEIEIPSDGVIPIRVEAANRPDVTKTYTLTIERSSAPGPGPGTGGGGGSGGGADPNPAEGNIADIGKDAEVSVKDGDGGRKLAAISLKTETVLNAIKNAKNGEELFVQVPSAADSYDLVLPAEAFRALAEAKAKLRLKGDPASVVIDPEAWTSGFGDKASAVHFKVDRASAQEEKAWLDGLKAKFGGLTGGSGLYRFAAEAAEGDGTVPLTASRPDAALGYWTTTSSGSAAVYGYDPSLQAWSFVSDVSGTAGLKWAGVDAKPRYYGIVAFANPFADIGGHWAKGHIEWMAARLYVNGITADTFQPDRKVTRAEFAAMLARIVGAKSEAAGASPFDDVKAEDWYYEAVRTVAAAKLIEGDGRGKFRPNDFVTREQMTAMSWRAYSLLVAGAVPAREEEIQSLLQPFADKGKIKSWAKADVASALKAGLAQGVGGSRFDPDGVATRAQAATVLRRIAEKLGSPE
ncbi:S-layer homology domain-containing protein [Cohnella xylanilytica]|uniref:S-layer homology domain-containing protein n=1 Tax=Cohnella xylanilytica TaxID=557555 RepID=UPI001BB38BFA|nr:S-layer homology domain-containing protein [Cohnella xylanilytica]